MIMLKKTISFVLICLLIINMLPATAYAATKMTLNKTSKTLYLNEDNMTETNNSFDFSVKNKPTDYKTKYTFTWYSDDPQIVEMSKGGIATALKVGETKIHCDIRSKSTRNLKQILTATVTVKQNAATVRITNAPDDNQLYVGESFDFDREQKARDGSSSTDKTMWFVSNEEIGSINSSGLFTAISPGEVEICAKTYQSTATLNLGYTAESEPVTITVLENPAGENPIIDSLDGTASISGEAKYGQTISVDTSNITGIPEGEGTLIYQWMSDEYNVGEDLPEYTIESFDIEKTITCQITHSLCSGKIIAQLEGTVEKADAPTVEAPTSIYMLKNTQSEYYYDLTNLSMPQDADGISYTVEEPSDGGIFEENPTIYDGEELYFTSASVESGTDTLDVTIHSDNYEDTTATLTFEIVEEIPAIPEDEEDDDGEPSAPEDEEESEHSTPKDEASHKKKSSQSNEETTSEEATESVEPTPLPQEIFIDNVMQQITIAKEGETATIDGSELGIFSFSQTLIKNISNNRKATYILRYRYMGVEYETIIPANAEIIIDEKISWFGPLYILGGGLGPNVITTIK